MFRLKAHVLADVGPKEEETATIMVTWRGEMSIAGKGRDRPTQLVGWTKPLRVLLFEVQSYPENRDRPAACVEGRVVDVLVIHGEVRAFPDGKIIIGLQDLLGLSAPRRRRSRCPPPCSSNSSCARGPAYDRRPCSIVSFGADSICAIITPAQRGRPIGIGGVPWGITAVGPTDAENMPTFLAVSAPNSARSRSGSGWQGRQRDRRLRSRRCAGRRRVGPQKGGRHGVAGIIGVVELGH